MAVTMNDIASRAGTSVAAVSVALNGAKSTTLKLSPETRDRILLAAGELGYRRNPIAGALATGKSHVLGLMLPHASAYANYDPYYSLVITGVTAAAARHGFNLMLYSATAEDQGERAAKMIDRLIAGLILVSTPTGSVLYDECDRQGIPYVSIFGDPARARMTMGSDDFEGGLLATRHLIGLGHRRIAHLSGAHEIVTSEPRRQGYLAALREAGIEPDPRFFGSGEFKRSFGYEAAIELFSLPKMQRPTAIFAANDLSAHGVLDAAAECGLAVPGDISVVGYDDTWYAEIMQPALTSVHMDVAQLGNIAAEMLLATIDERPVANPHAVLPVSLTIRESTARNSLKL